MDGVSIKTCIEFGDFPASHVWLHGGNPCTQGPRPKVFHSDLGLEDHTLASPQAVAISAKPRCGTHQFQQQNIGDKIDESVRNSCFTQLCQHLPTTHGCVPMYPINQRGWGSEIFFVKVNGDHIQNQALEWHGGGGMPLSAPTHLSLLHCEN
jgi:hypothetical protein